MAQQTERYPSSSNRAFYYHPRSQICQLGLTNVKKLFPGHYQIYVEKNTFHGKLKGKVTSIKKVLNKCTNIVIIHFKNFTKTLFQVLNFIF